MTFLGDKGPVRNEPRPLIEDLDALPVPDFSLVDPLATYRDACGLPRAITVLEVGRGLPTQLRLLFRVSLLGQKAKDLFHSEACG